MLLQDICIPFPAYASYLYRQSSFLCRICDFCSIKLPAFDMTRLEGMNLEGQDISKGVLLPLGNKAEKATIVPAISAT